MFLEVYLIKQKDFSVNTQKSYRESLSLLLKYFKEEHNISYAKMGFEYMTYSNICNFLNWLETTRKSSNTTINQRLMSVRSFAKYCAIADPAKIYFQVEMKNVPSKETDSKVVDFLTENAMKVLVEQIDTSRPIGLRDKMFILLMYDLGARCQEMLGIKLCDLHLNKSEPTVYVYGKGNKTRIIPLSLEIVQLLKIYLEKFHPITVRNTQDYLFYVTAHGIRNKMSSDAVALFLRKYSSKGHSICEDLPERIHPHQIRHSRAMHLYRKGMPQVLLSEFLGHSNPATTKIYYGNEEKMGSKRQKVTICRNLPEIY